MRNGELILAVDEAGRGPAIGPMVMCGLVTTPAGQKKLSRLGATDSKTLSRADQEDLAEVFREVAAAVLVEEITAPEIDGGNLNRLEAETTAALAGEVKPDRLLFDVPTHPGGVSGYVADLRYLIEKRGSGRLSLVGETGADVTYPAVGAAATIAKVWRDGAVRQLRERFGDFGWGYPGEEKTRRFIADRIQNGGLPDCVRASWRTVEEIREGLHTSGKPGE